MLYEAPTAEEYKNKYFKNGVWIERANVHSYNSLKKYHSGKIRAKSQKEIELENRIKEMEELKNK